MATMPTNFTVKVTSQPVEEKCQDEYHSFYATDWPDRMLFCRNCAMTLRFEVDDSGS